MPAAGTVNSGPPRTPATFAQASTTTFTNNFQASFRVLPQHESSGSSRDESESLNNNPQAAPGQDFRDIIDHHRQLVADDNDGEDRIGSLNAAVPKTTLKDLFDFTIDEWAKKYNHYTKFGYDEELELYDLLEMDAGGEVDDLDDFTQDILMN